MQEVTRPSCCSWFIWSCKQYGCSWSGVGLVAIWVDQKCAVLACSVPSAIQLSLSADATIMPADMLCSSQQDDACMSTKNHSMLHVSHLYACMHHSCNISERMSLSILILRLLIHPYGRPVSGSYMISSWWCATYLTLPRPLTSPCLMCNLPHLALYVTTHLTLP